MNTDINEENELHESTSMFKATCIVIGSEHPCAYLLEDRCGDHMIGTDTYLGVMFCLEEDEDTADNRDELQKVVTMIDQGLDNIILSLSA